MEEANVLGTFLPKYVTYVADKEPYLRKNYKITYYKVEVIFERKFNGETKEMAVHILHKSNLLSPTRIP